MPNMDWKSLSLKSKQKFGTYGEYYAKMEFASYGFDVFTSEVDDHGVDFVVKGNNGFYEIQVKSIQSTSGYVFMKKENFNVKNKDLYLCLLIFEQGRFPDLYLISAEEWINENELLRNRDYGKPGQLSKPEWGINTSKKNMCLLSKYTFDKIILDM
jgi:hypothetical protein